MSSMLQEKEMSKRQSVVSRLTFSNLTQILGQDDVELRVYSKISKMVLNEQLQTMSNPLEDRPRHKFCTGSSYEGQWDPISMCGIGKYVFQHGVMYEGQFKDGMFHGSGTLSYPSGQKLDGEWENGEMIKYNCKFPDGLLHTYPWKYCQMPDRRFFVSIQGGINPAGNEYLTQRQPTGNLPENCYDLNDSFYDLGNGCIFDETSQASTIDDILYDWEYIRETPAAKILNGYENMCYSRIPDAEEKEWITTNCRKSWDENVGCQPDLFEFWTSGRKKEKDEMEHKLRRDGGPEICSEPDKMLI